jgi:hypothetical protein
MNIFSRENKVAILGVSHLRTERVDVPEWGVSVIVAEMSGLARDAFYAKKKERELSISESQADLLCATLIDETGAPVLDESDIARLQVQSSTVLDRLATVAVRINGLEPNAVDEAKKNSETIQPEDSGSASLSPSDAQ